MSSIAYCMNKNIYIIPPDNDNALCFYFNVRS
jgi:hypothetical protein